MLENSHLPPKVAKNKKVASNSAELTGYWRFPYHFTHCCPSPNRITLFFSYKKRSWGLIPTPSKRIEKLFQNPFPFYPKFCNPL